MKLKIAAIFTHLKKYCQDTFKHFLLWISTDPNYSYFINWWAKCLFSFSQGCFLLSGSLALETLLIGVHCKKCYVNV